MRHIALRVIVCVVYGVMVGVVLTLTLIATFIDPTDRILYLTRSPDHKNHDFSQYHFYCHKCSSHVDLKTKHCGQCNRCTSHFDHHCKWLNNCVGGRNY